MPAVDDGPALLVPIELDVLTLRPDRTDLIDNGDFLLAGTGPTSWTNTGEADGSAAAGWNAVNLGPQATTDTELLAADATGPARLHVTTDAANAGVIAHILAAGVGRRATIVSADIYVLRGNVALSVGNPAGGTPHLDAGPVGVRYGNDHRWITLRTLYDQGVPGSVMIAASPWPEGAEYWLTNVSIRAFDTGNLIGNHTFTEPDTSVPPEQPPAEGATLEVPSIAAEWTIRHVDAAADATTTVSYIPDPATPDDTDRRVLQIQTTSKGCGLRQQLLAGGTGPAGTRASIRIRCPTGAVALSCGPDRDPNPTATVTADDTWQTIVVDPARPPAASFDVWATTTGGATFLVDQAWVQPQPHDQLLTNPDFDDPADPADPLAPIVVGPNPDPTSGYSAGSSAAASWGVWNTGGDSVTITRLLPTTRPAGEGRMLHVTTTHGGCGIVQVFLPEDGTSPRQTTAAAWVFINSGKVIIGTGDGGHTDIDATEAVTGEWRLITASNGVWPANEFIVYAADGAADYYVDVAQISEIAPWSVVADTGLADPGAVTVSGQHPLRPPPFANRPTGRDPGAYLRWALPDAQTRANDPGEGDTALTFPAIADQWVICRVSGTPRPTTEGDSRTVAAWLLDVGADGIPTMTSLQDPMPGAKPVTGLAGVDLTALGPGDPGWSAYYDNVENRLGFYDRLDGVTGPVAYLVAGWHADAHNDPLDALPDLAAQAERLDDLGWAVASHPPLLTRAVYHGAAVAIGWPDTGWPGDVDGTLSDPMQQRPNATEIRMITAPTLVDALTTLLARADETVVQKEVLAAFLSGAVGRYDAVDGAAAVSASAHAAGFGSNASTPTRETIWQASSAPGGAGQFQNVARSTPRQFVPGEPVILLQGGGRSFTYGGDGRFSTDGTLACRISGQPITTLGPSADGPVPPEHVIHIPPALLPGTAVTIPPDIVDLLIELSALDPGSAPPPNGAAVPPAQARTAWWLTWDPGQPAVTLTPHGVLPSPIAITPPTAPWTPVHLDWEVEFVPAAAGMAAWSLNGTDLAPPAGGVPLDQDKAQTLTGRTDMIASPAGLLAAAAKQALRWAWMTAAADTGVDDEFTAQLARADILGGAITGLTALLQGQDLNPTITLPDAPAPPPTPPPSSSAMPVRAGHLQLVKARLVDAYGQVLDLPVGANATPAPVQPTRRAAADATSAHAADTTPIAASPTAVTLAPRLTGGARLVFEYVDAAGSGTVAADLISPVCGYLIADYEGHSLDFFSSDGAAAGRLTEAPLDGSGSAWQSAPGIASTFGANPAFANPYLAGVVDGMLSHDRVTAQQGTSTAVSDTLRAIDTARFTIALLPVGDEHLALLLGHPAVVFRAQLSFSVDGSDTGPASPAIPVSLGALDRLQDGLLGYFVDDDYSHLYVDPAVETLAVPGNRGEAVGLVASDYIASNPLSIRPGQTIDLTLLVEPSADVHITTGVLPQKAIGQRRAWIDDAMHNMTPSLRVDPILLPATQVELPLPTDVHGTWTWQHRLDPYTWQNESAVPSNDVSMSGQPLIAEGGWLQLALQAEQSWDNYGQPVMVTSVHIDDRDDPTSVVTAIGGADADGDGFQWRQTLDEAVALSTTGRFKYFMTRHRDGNPAAAPTSSDHVLEILGTTSSSQLPTLTTATLEDPVNRLFELPECDVPIMIWDPATTAEDAPDARQRYLLVAGTGLELEVRGGPAAVADGTPLQAATAASPDDGPSLTSRQFQFVWTDHAFFRIVAWNSGACLEVASASTDDGAAVQIGTYTGAPHQQWQLVSVGADRMIIRARHSRQVMTVDTTPGAGIACVQRPYTGRSEQEWMPKPLPTDPSDNDTNATVLEMGVPASMYADQAYGIEVTVRNTSNNVWAGSGHFDLRFTDGLTPLTISGVSLSGAATTGMPLPGQAVALSAVVGAFSSPAALAGAVQLVFEKFDPPGTTTPVLYGLPSAPLTVQVVALVPGALAVDLAFDPLHLNPADPDSALITGHEKTVVVEMVNRGTFPLYRTYLTLAAVNPGDWQNYNWQWGSLYDSLAPGDLWTTTIVVNPKFTGTGRLQFQVTQWPSGTVIGTSASADVTTIGLRDVITASGASATSGQIAVSKNEVVPLRAVLTDSLGDQPPGSEPVTMRVVYPTGTNSASNVPVVLTPHTTIAPEFDLDTSKFPPGLNNVYFLLGGDRKIVQIKAP